MASIDVARIQEAAAEISADEVQRLRSNLRGRLLQPGEPGYDDARTVWNGMIDRRPALIAQPAGAADIMRAVDFAREQGLVLAVKGGGHNIAGNAVCDSGLMIDLSLMKSVRVDPTARRAYVEPGAILSDVDRETQAFGLATPLGINSTTGVAGLTLGGGFGWLSRKYGLTIDNLLSVEIVTADGNLLHASADTNDDLFWAIRGGGGNFGIVSMFEFQLHPVGPEVYSGLVVFPFSQARELLARYREFTASAPNDLNVWMVIRQAPPLPFLPESTHGQMIVAFPIFYAGNPEEGKRAARPILQFGNPVGSHLGVQPYADWQTTFDPLLTRGARNYWKSHNFSTLSDAALDTVITYARDLPGPQCEVFIGMLGGATMRPPPDAMAYAARDAMYVMNVHGRWDSPDDDRRMIEWSRSLFQATAPFASGGAYVNFMTEEERGRVPAAYGRNYSRLTEIKGRYDPTNLFCMNQNIPPTTPSDIR